MSLLLGVAGVLLVAALVLLGVAAREYARRARPDLDGDGPAMPAPPAPPAPKAAPRPSDGLPEGLPGLGAGDAPVRVAPPAPAPAPMDAAAAGRRSAGATIIAFDDDDDQD